MITIGTKIYDLEDGEVGRVEGLEPGSVRIDWGSGSGWRITTEDMEDIDTPEGRYSTTAPGTPNDEESVLSEAQRVVDGPRRETYGHPRENHARTAAMWTAYLANKLKDGVEISMRDVCQLNSLQKISRDANAPHRDNLVDQAGWARNAEMVS